MFGVSTANPGVSTQPLSEVGRPADVVDSFPLIQHIDSGLVQEFQRFGNAWVIAVASVAQKYQDILLPTSCIGFH